MCVCVCRREREGGAGVTSAYLEIEEERREHDHGDHQKEERHEQRLDRLLPAARARAAAPAARADEPTRAHANDAVGAPQRGRRANVTPTPHIRSPTSGRVAIRGERERSVEISGAAARDVSETRDTARRPRRAVGARFVRALRPPRRCCCPPAMRPRTTRLVVSNTSNGHVSQTKRERLRRGMSSAPTDRPTARPPDRNRHAR